MDAEIGMNIPLQMDGWIKFHITFRIKVINRLSSKTGSSFWKQKNLLRASVMSKMKSLFVEVQSVARTHVCQDSGINDILSRQPLNVTDTGTVHMAEQTGTYGRAFQDTRDTGFWKCA